MDIKLVDKETAFYIKTLEPLYKKTVLLDVDVNEIDIDKLLRLATIDNALDYVARYMTEKQDFRFHDGASLEAIVTEGNKERIQLSDTIEDLKRHIQTDYIIFKTYKGASFHRIGNDIDVVVKHQDLRDIHQSLLSKGYQDVVRFPRHERCIMVKKPGQMNLHIQSRIHWCGKEYLDERLIWENPRDVTYAGHHIQINNVNADFLIHLAHINFEHPFYKFSELLYLFTLASMVDYQQVIGQAQKYRWKQTLLRNINLMNNIHRMLYDEPVTVAVPFKQLNIPRVSFPLMFTRRHMILSVFEKRITYYLLGRIFKLCRVLITGETCSYTQPPERKKLKKKGQRVIGESIIRGAINSTRHRLLRTLDVFYNKP